MNDWARVKQAVDIAEVVGRYVPLKKNGARLTGLCPFHAEKTPSFSVYLPLQIFKCFGCGKGGDVFVFLQEHLRLDPAESLHMLADEAGITLTERGPNQRKERDQKERALAALEEAARRYRKELQGERGGPARAFLERRRISAETAAAFGLGFAPARGLNLAEDLRRDGHRVEDLEAAGLARRRDGRLRDAFWDRILVPIRDERGRAIAFGGRRLVDGPGAPEPKYINSSDGPVFHKGTVLYGLDRARATILEEDRAVLVEGYTDVLLAHQAGLTCTVAALGTAITRDHARKLRRLAPRAVLFLDGDAAGVKAALRAVPLLLGAGLDVQVLALGEGADPGDYFSSGKGREDFDQLLTRDGRPALDFLLEAHGARRASGFEGRLRVAEQCLAALQEIEDPTRRSVAVAQVAAELDLPPEALQRSVAQSVGRRRPAERDPATEERVEPARMRPPRTAQEIAEFDLLVGLYARPEWREKIEEYLNEEVLEHPLNRRLYQLLRDHPDGELEELLELVPGDGSAQGRLLELERSAEVSDAAKMIEGAIQYFRRAGQERRKRELEEGFRERERGAEDDSDAVREFLRAIEESVRNRP